MTEIRGANGIKVRRFCGIASEIDRFQVCVKFLTSGMVTCGTVRGAALSLSTSGKLGKHTLGGIALESLPAR